MSYLGVNIRDINSPSISKIERSCLNVRKNLALSTFLAPHTTLLNVYDGDAGMVLLYSMYFLCSKSEEYTVHILWRCFFIRY